MGKINPTCHEVSSCAKCHEKLNKAPAASTHAAPQSHRASNWGTGLHGAYAKRSVGSPHPAGFSRSKFKDLTVCYQCHGNGVDGVSAGPLP